MKVKPPVDLPFGTGRVLQLSPQQEANIEASIRQSERARIVAWLRTSVSAGDAIGDAVLELAQRIEQGKHWER